MQLAHMQSKARIDMLYLPLRFDLILILSLLHARFISGFKIFGILP